MKFLVIFLLLPSLLSCNGDSFSIEKASNVAPEIDVLEIGDEHGGGIYAGEIAGYQLIATPGNCTDSATPICDGTTDSILITKDISMGPDYCSLMDYGGYTDWYYPTIVELTQLYDNRMAIGSFAAEIYWTGTDGFSTDYSAQFWATLDFADGTEDEYAEYSGGKRVRCVRQQPI